MCASNDRMSGLAVSPRNWGQSRPRPTVSVSDIFALARAPSDLQGLFAAHAVFTSDTLLGETWMKSPLGLVVDRASELFGCVAEGVGVREGDTVPATNSPEGWT